MSQKALAETGNKYNANKLTSARVRKHRQVVFIYKKCCEKFAELIAFAKVHARGVAHSRAV